jgi:hypothetical protein
MGGRKYHERVQETYTLVSRARHGFISTKPFSYGVFKDKSFTVSYDENNLLSNYPPIYTGIDKDVIDNFKNYKAQVLDGLIYDDSENHEGGNGQTVGPIKTNKVLDKQQMIECSPGFV